jgi:hypothetical protein
MTTGTLKAVILDNDETTGSYIIVYSMLKSLQNLGHIEPQLFTYILERLAVWMVKHSIFRRGLIGFLSTLVDLKKAGKIDAVIMYTNQYEPNENLSESLPRCIQYMFMYLVPGFVFDHILTRPENPLVINNSYLKQFKRVLDLYPYRPSDNTQILFFDDLAVPMYLNDDGVKVTSDSSRILVDPYYCVLYKEDIKDCVKFCLNNMVDLKEFTHSVTYYYSLMVNKNHCISNIPSDCSYFTELVKKKYDIDGGQADA